MIGGEVDILLSGEKTLVKFGDALFQLPFGANKAPGFGDLGFSNAGDY